MRHVELPPICVKNFCDEPARVEASERLVAGGTGAEAAGALDNLLLGNGDDVDVDGVELGAESVVVADRQKIEKTYAEGLEEVLGVLVDVEHARLGVLGEVEGGDLGNVLILALALLFLELERDTADGTTLDTLHQVSGVTGDLWKLLSELCALPSEGCVVYSHLVAQALGGNDGNLIADALVGLEVESQLGVVTLNDDLGGLLDSLGTNATHFCGMCVLAEEEVVEVEELFAARFREREKADLRRKLCCSANFLAWRSCTVRIARCAFMDDILSNTEKIEHYS
jgi:hypothetical protein